MVSSKACRQWAAQRCTVMLLLPCSAQEPAAKPSCPTPSAGTKMNISDPSRDDLMQKGIESGESRGVHFAASCISSAHLAM